MGVHGMDARSGFTTPNVLEADTDRALIGAGRRLVVVADSSKWGVIGISSIARLDEADTLVTDSGLAGDARDIASDAVRELLVASVPAGASGGDGAEATGGPTLVAAGVESRR
jgi:DeoR/GlpR family transcriptional regulator of sugar metabolism